MATLEEEVNKPSHYRSHESGIEAIEVTRCLIGDLSNAWKYAMRYDCKGTPKKDLMKLCWYLKDWYKHFLDENNNDIDIDINKQEKMDLEDEKQSNEEDSLKTESSNENNLRKEIINLFDNNKIDGDEDMDPEEQLQRLIRKCNNEKNEMNEEILKEINKLYSEYKEEENLLNKKKKEFNDHNKQYENIITNLRGIKNQIDSKIIEDLSNQADAINILPNTFKEIKYYEIKDVDKINKDYPFDENSNIILCHL